MERTYDVYVFELSATAFIKDEEQFKDKIQSTLIPSLNNNAASIADKMRDNIKRLLPYGANIEVEIEFYPGSIEIAGIILIAEKLGKLAGAVKLIEYLAKAIKFAINRIFREAIQSIKLNDNQIQVQVESISTDIQLVDQPQAQVVRQKMSTQKLLFFLIASNTVLTLIILILLLLKRSF